MKSARLKQLFETALREARKSRFEEGRIQPYVGAILTTQSGRVLLRAHRGKDDPREHAEFTLLRDAERRKIPLDDKILFVTYEPCTKRGPGKTPCALRVARSGIKKIYIGQLDTNPGILGRGEHILRNHMEVERFPHKYVMALRALNAEFSEKHRDETFFDVDRRFADLALETTTYGRTRRGANLMNRTADIIADTATDAWMFAGSTRWMSDMIFDLAVAAKNGQSIRVLVDPSGLKDDFEQHRLQLNASGVDVAVAAEPIELRGTLISPGDLQRSRFLMVEEYPETHGIALDGDRAARLISLIRKWFTHSWEAAAERFNGSPPRFEPLDIEQVIKALRRGVSAYHSATLTFTKVPVRHTIPLARAVYPWRTERLRRFFGLKESRTMLPCGRLRGTDWVHRPPVMERQPNGKLVVIDGTHRVYRKVRSGEPTIDAIVVDRCRTALPARAAYSWDSVRILDDAVRREERYSEYNNHNFRDIAGAVALLANEAS